MSPHPDAHSTLFYDGRIARVIEEALMEDIGAGDITTASTVDPEAQGSAILLAKGEGIVSGVEIAHIVFHTIDDEIRFTPLVRDGQAVTPGVHIATIEGRLAAILKAERTALNFLQRMSGISTLTAAYVKAVAGTKAKIIDTRKTAPGLRAIDKLAVALGGGVNNRFGLDDMVLIKDNHIAAAGSLTNAVKNCVAYLDEHGIRVPIEVETQNIAQVREALAFERVNRIMLDNYALEDMRAAVELIAGTKEVEASGGMTLETVRAVAETGVDLISVGALTHSVKGLDISLDIQQA
jgi:nicotinate-nucleotide pyrophosphorylase (carboxylating)